MAKTGISRRKLVLGSAAVEELLVGMGFDHYLFCLGYILLYYILSVTTTSLNHY